MENIFLIEYDTFEELSRAASSEAATTFSLPLPGIIYSQGRRWFITTSFPFSTLSRRVVLDSAKKGEDPTEHINRPLLPDHVHQIVKYLTEQTQYILPAVTLSVQKPPRFHVLKSSSAVRQGVLILPDDLLFLVTDGQHRIKAIEESIRLRPELANDAITVTIVPEIDIERIHQDFVDCAQVKPIPPALLTVFNQRDPLARFSKLMIDRVDVFRGRIEKVGKTVGKNSVNLFTMNQVRAGLAEFLTGDSMGGAPRLKNLVDQRLGVQEMFDKYLEQTVKFFQLFTESNLSWKDVASKADNLLKDQVDAGKLRQEFVHFTATGLIIIGRVGHAIIKMDPEEQPELIKKLANINWSRNGEIWRGNVMLSNEKIASSRSAVEVAIAKVKKEIGVNLSPTDLRRLESPGELFP